MAPIPPSERGRHASMHEWVSSGERESGTMCLAAVLACFAPVIPSARFAKSTSLSGVQTGLRSVYPLTDVLSETYRPHSSKPSSMSFHMSSFCAIWRNVNSGDDTYNTRPRLESAGVFTIASAAGGYAPCMQWKCASLVVRRSLRESVSRSSGARSGMASLANSSLSFFA